MVLFVDPKLALSEVFEMISVKAENCKGWIHTGTGIAYSYLGMGNWHKINNYFGKKCCTLAYQVEKKIIVLNKNKSLFILHVTLETHFPHSLCTVGFWAVLNCLDSKGLLCFVLYRLVLLACI